MGELCQRPLFRDEAAHAIAARLPRAEPALARTACLALGGPGSPLALPALVEALAHGDGGVRRAAHAALRQLTRRELPAEADAWRGELGL